MLVVVDTNIWVSAILTPDSFAGRIANELADGRFQPVFSDDSLLELKDAVTSPRNVRKYGWRLAALNQVVALLNDRGLELGEPHGYPSIARDPDDDLFIALTIAAHADYLVTRDDDLKDDPAVREHLAAHGVSVVSIREFVAELDASAE